MQAWVKRGLALLAGGLFLVLGTSVVVVYLSSKSVEVVDGSPWTLVVVTALLLLGGVALTAWAVVLRSANGIIRIALCALAIAACVAAFVPVAGLNPSLAFKLATVAFAVLLMLRISGKLKLRFQRSGVGDAS